MDLAFFFFFFFLLLEESDLITTRKCLSLHRWGALPAWSLKSHGVSTLQHWYLGIHGMRLKGLWIHRLSSQR